MDRLFVGIATVCALSGVAYAQQATEKVAEDEFNKGNTAYNLGKWDEAIEHFTKAYEAMPLPEFLYNIAQSHRQAGNCKLALHFYKRFRSLKETDKQAPLSKQKRDEIERFIKELTECAANTDKTAETKPDSLDVPPSAPKPAPTTTSPATKSASTTPVAAPVTGATTKPASTATVPTTTATTTRTTAAVEMPDVERADSPSVSASETTDHANFISARAFTGISMLQSGDLNIPIQPSFAVTAGYPLAAGPLVLDLGIGLSYTPLPYQVMGEQQQGTLFGARAVASAQYAISTKLSLRGDVGGGIAKIGGLAMGNPITADYSSQSFTLPSVRVAVAADYALTANVAATVSPFGFAFSPGADGMYGNSLREIDILVGIAYRQ